MPLSSFPYLIAAPLKASNVCLSLKSSSLYGPGLGIGPSWGDRSEAAITLCCSLWLTETNAEGPVGTCLSPLAPAWCPGLPHERQHRWPIAAPGSPPHIWLNTYRSTCQHRRSLSRSSSAASLHGRPPLVTGCAHFPMPLASSDLPNGPRASGKLLVTFSGSSISRFFILTSLASLTIIEGLIPVRGLFPVIHEHSFPYCMPADSATHLLNVPLLALWQLTPCRLSEWQRQGDRSFWFSSVPSPLCSFWPDVQV